MHLLESGFIGDARPLILLLHGFPELAYSWRQVLPALAAAGYWVVAPDQRGYGATTGWDGRYDADIESYGMLNLVRDTVGLVTALGAVSVAAVVGHDFGSPVAAWCALMHPELFRAVVLMSAPFAGPPRAPASVANTPMVLMQAALAALSPPRKHYHWYYSTPSADAQMSSAAQGIHAFLRAYYHVKSADWKRNRPFALARWSARELARLPTYYVMNLHEDMAATVAGEMPTPAQIDSCHWLTENELRVYAAEFSRTGFQGGLHWYRAAIDFDCICSLSQFAGRAITVPAYYIAGNSDWGIHQTPGALQSMQSSACADFRGTRLIDGAGHWVQQEQPAAVCEELLQFFRR